MPQYTFKYFPLKALGESVRLLLAAGGEDYSDVRVAHEEWLLQKDSSPYGQMPILEIDGKQYAQSVAISRYFGRKFHLAGDTLEQDLEIDMMVDTFNDLRSNAQAAHYEKDKAIQENKYAEGSAARNSLLKKLETTFGANNGHVALNKLTWGDFIVAGAYDYLKVMMRIADFDSKYPNIKKVYDNVYALPKVKAYADKAPKTDF